MNDERQYSEQECNYSIKIGMVGGFLIGWAIGVALSLFRMRVGRGVMVSGLRGPSSANKE